MMDRWRRAAKDIIAARGLKAAYTAGEDEDFVQLYNVRNKVNINQNNSLIQIQRSVEQDEDNSLHKLIATKNVDAVKRYLREQCTPDQKYKMIERAVVIDVPGEGLNELSCLHLAACFGLSELVGIFLEEGVEVNKKDNKGNTALMWAARWGHDQTVKTLIKAKTYPEVDNNLQNHNGSTALFWAVRYGHVGTVKLLLQEGKADPNLKRYKGLVAPLIVASAYGYNEVVELLLSNTNIECDINISIRGDERPIHRVAKEGNIDVLTTLLNYKAKLYIDKPDKIGDTPLLLAAQNNHIEMVNKLICAGADVFHMNNEGDDIWSYAVDSKDTNLLEKVVETCLKEGIEIKHIQLLCRAAAKGRIDMIDFLLNSGHDPKSKDSEGCTFLHHAARNDKFVVIDKFHKDISIDTPTKDGITPLHIACANGFDTTIKTLLKCNAKVDVKNYFDETPLHLAAKSTRIMANTVRKLVDYAYKKHGSVVLNAKDKKSNNCLHVAGKFAQPNVMWEFRFVRLRDQNVKGHTPIHEAVRSEQPEALHKMLDIFEETKKDARINEQSYEKLETVLHLAADEGLSSCLERLIDLGADLSIQDVEGNTVLHRLAESTVKGPEYIKRYIEVFDTIMKNVLKWWCIKAHIAYDNRADYQQLRKKVSLHLMNEIQNDINMSVLEYSFQIGANDIISRLLMMPDITMFKVSDSQYMFDVSRLTPHTKNSCRKGLCIGSKVGTAEDEAKDQKHDREEGVVSGIDMLIMNLHMNKLEEDLPKKVQIFDLPPMTMIKNHYIRLARRADTFFFFFHFVYMIIFTYVGLDLLAKLRDDENAINSSDPETLLLYIFVPLDPALKVLEASITLIMYCTSREIRIKSTMLSYGFPGAVLIVRISQQLIYASLIIAWIISFSVRDHNQDYVLAVSLWLGWLNSLAYLRTFELGHLYYSIMLRLQNDFPRFIIIYLFILFAHGFALHVFFQISPGVVETYDTAGDTLFLTFNMMLGRGELFDDDFKKDLAEVGRKATFAKVVFTIYVIYSTIILLNLLIAMLNDSYSKTLKKQQDLWLVDSVTAGLDVENNFISKRFFSRLLCAHGSFKYKGNDIFKFIETDPESDPNGRWYVTIDKDKVESYLREKENKKDERDRQETLEEKTETILQKVDELLSRLENKKKGKRIHKSSATPTVDNI